MRLGGIFRKSPKDFTQYNNNNALEKIDNILTAKNIELKKCQRIAKYF